jgi:hypothetical protein
MLNPPGVDGVTEDKPKAKPGVDWVVGKEEELVGSVDAPGVKGG